MRMGNNGNFGGERNKSVQRDRSLRNDIGSIDFQISAFPPPFLPFPPSIRIPSRKRSCFYFALETRDISLPPDRVDPLPPPSPSLLVLLSSVQPPHRDQLSRYSTSFSTNVTRSVITVITAADTFLTTVRRLRSRYSFHKHGNTVSII